MGTFEIGQVEMPLVNIPSQVNILSEFNWLTGAKMAMTHKHDTRQAPTRQLLVQDSVLKQFKRYKEQATAISSLGMQSKPIHQNPNMLSSTTVKVPNFKETESIETPKPIKLPITQNNPYAQNNVSSKRYMNINSARVSISANSSMGDIIEHDNLDSKINTPIDY